MIRATIIDAIRRAAHLNGSSYPPGPYIAGVYADAIIKGLGLESYCNRCGRTHGQGECGRD